jgi:hypothetical protein
MGYSQIWLNRFCDDHQFGYKKFPKKEKEKT